MRSTRLLVIVTLLLAGACSDGDDDGDDGAAPTTDTTVAARPTTTLPLTPVDQGRAQRVATVRDLELGASETFGVALHPGSEIRLTARTDDALEVCQATTDAELDPSFGSWPGKVFPSCIQFDDGRAVIPATPVDSYHVGFAVRGPAGTSAASVDELTIDYEAVDGFFLLAFPPVEVGEGTPPIVVVPETSSTIEVDSYGDSRFRAHHGMEVSVSQDGEALARHEPGDQTHGLPYGPAAPGAEVEITGRATEAFERPNYLVNWS
jgi:hypothetical protein